MSLVSERALKDGEILLSAGTLLDAIYLIEEGELLLLDLATTTFRLLHIFKRGDLVGEEYLYRTKKSSYALMARGKTKIKILEKSAVETQLATKDVWLKTLFDTLLDRLEQGRSELEQQGIPVYEELPLSPKERSLLQKKLLP